MSMPGHPISHWLPCPVLSWIPKIIGTWGDNNYYLTSSSLFCFFVCVLLEWSPEGATGIRTTLVLVRNYQLDGVVVKHFRVTGDRLRFVPMVFLHIESVRR